MEFYRLGRLYQWHANNIRERKRERACVCFREREREKERERDAWWDIPCFGMSSETRLSKIMYVIGRFD